MLRSLVETGLGLSALALVVNIVLSSCVLIARRHMDLLVVSSDVRRMASGVELASFVGCCLVLGGNSRGHLDSPLEDALLVVTLLTQTA